MPVVTEHQSQTDTNFTGRRQFLKSLFGLGNIQSANAQAAIAANANQNAPKAATGSFWWADLKTGQVGFPTGTKPCVASLGSVAKLISTCAFHEENSISDNRTFECRGSVTIHGKTYHCQTAHGNVSLIEALGQSCNIYFAHAADTISPAVFLHYARLFGFAESCCEQASGHFPEKPLADVQSYVLGLSPDFQPQALQLLQLAALIGTKGHLTQLHSAEKPLPVPSLRTVSLKESTWSLLDQGMRIACRAGTAKNLDPENKLQIACKTGTVPHGKTFESWICGYFPHEKPRYAFCAHAAQGTSQDVAVPIARKFLFATEWP